MDASKYCSSASVNVDKFWTAGGGVSWNMACASRGGVGNGGGSGCVEALAGGGRHDGVAERASSGTINRVGEVTARTGAEDSAAAGTGAPAPFALLPSLLPPLAPSGLPKEEKGHMGTPAAVPVPVAAAAAASPLLSDAAPSWGRSAVPKVNGHSDDSATDAVSVAAVEASAASPGRADEDDNDDDDGGDDDITDSVSAAATLDLMNRSRNSARSCGVADGWVSLNSCSACMYSRFRRIATGTGT
jgi:hypothetical protein